MTSDPRSELAELAASHNVPKNGLLVLAPSNDPWNAGGPADQRDGEWFTSLWDLLGARGGVHLRRCHYQALSHDLERPDGNAYRAYLNDDASWSFLCKAATKARLLGMVPAEAFDDRRNSEPVVHEEAGWPRYPTVDVDVDGWEVPSGAALARALNVPSIRLPEPYLAGYDPDGLDQPAGVELWVEKSTMRNELLPLCRELGVTYVDGAGFQSISTVVQSLRRLRSNADAVGWLRPLRVLYISDFDPAGDKMPQAAARQFEFWADRYAKGLDIALEPICLTHEQVLEYDLPRIPVKADDTRRAGFEARHGEGAVELDALEALHPGVLASIVEDAVAPFRRDDTETVLAVARQAARVQASTAWRAECSDEAGDLERLAEQVAAVVQGYQAEATELGERLDASLAPFVAELDAVEAGLQDKANAFTVDLPPRPTFEEEAEATGGWLYRSCRQYLDQLANYRQRARFLEPGEAA